MDPTLQQRVEAALAPRPLVLDDSIVQANVELAKLVRDLWAKVAELEAKLAVPMPEEVQRMAIVDGCLLGDADGFLVWYADYESLAREAEALRKDATGCICKGNWRLIMSEVEHLIGRQYRDKSGQEFYFYGLVHGDDDYYYGMCSETSKHRLLSCVGSIEGHGFTLIDAAIDDKYGYLGDS